MKRNKLLLVSGIIGALYFVHLLVCCIRGVGIFAPAASGAKPGSMLVPYMICVGAAAAFNWIAWAMRSRGVALLAGIVYAVSIAFMWKYFTCVVVEMILCFVAYVTMKDEPSGSSGSVQGSR